MADDHEGAEPAAGLAYPCCDGSLSRFGTFQIGCKVNYWNTCHWRARHVRFYRDRRLNAKAMGSIMEERRC
jgi:hypothetical protein